LAKTKRVKPQSVSGCRPTTTNLLDGPSKLWHGRCAISVSWYSWYEYPMDFFFLRSL